MSKTETYNQAVDGAELRHVVLMSSTFRVSFDFQGGEDAAEKFIDQSVIDEPYFDSSTLLLMGTVRCRVWMNKAEDNTTEAHDGPEDSFQRSQFATEAVYAVAFKLDVEHANDTCAAFFERTAPWITWPYFRSHVAHHAGEAHLDIPVLPIQRLSVPFRPSNGYVESKESDASALLTAPQDE